MHESIWTVQHASTVVAVLCSLTASPVACHALNLAVSRMYLVYICVMRTMLQACWDCLVCSDLLHFWRLKVHKKRIAAVQGDRPPSRRR